MISTSSENKNQLIKIPGTPRKGMLETPNDNNIQGSQSNINNANNLINISAKDVEWEVRDENSIKQIDIKSGSTSKNQIIQDTKNLTMSDFEESFREENVPKKI